MHEANLAHISEPLDEVLYKGSKWNWGREQKYSFEKIKEILYSQYKYTQPSIFLKKNTIACTLTYVNPLWSDVSHYGLGAVLSHTVTDG